MNEVCKEGEVDKSKWPQGEWNREPDRVDFEHAGFPCLLHRGPGGHWCGYVGVNETHPYFGKDYDHADVEVHGGLTYSEKCSGHICHTPREGNTDNVWWFGFDCAHCGDLSPAFYRLGGITIDGDTYKNLMYVTEETKKLAEQLREKNEHKEQ